MSFETLAPHRYLNLATRRRSGETVKTPVWFALLGGEVVVGTYASTGKVKRIRHSPEAVVAPSTFRGRELAPAMNGVARLLSGGDATDAQKALAAKYGWQWKLLGRKIDTFLAISPR
jgi:PPOX class probable F420-dependent enzyme